MKYEMILKTIYNNDDWKYLFYFDIDDSEILVDILAQICEVLNDRYERKVSDNLLQK